ncbi:MAG TPA: hypothetical protein DCP92_18235 [Nitrospiraceae bacterium]|jgi:hypothetical protein|nr:hypothetical protein [Nitrospiraceae bacterium]
MPPNKGFVCIYCKIFCDEFPDEGFTEGKEAAGDEIYHFLIRELRYASDPATEETISGDYAIWYLASSEKFGVLQIDEQIAEWTFGGSNWERVYAFLHILHEKGILSDEQYDHLMTITNEGTNAFDDMYEIPAYLRAKQFSFRIQAQSFAPIFVVHWNGRVSGGVYIGLEHA